MKNTRKFLILLPIFLSVLMISLNVRAAGEVDTNFIASAFIGSPSVVIGSQETISQTIVQPDGKILIAGNFEVVGKYGRRHIARLNADGTIDLTFNPINLVSVESTSPEVRKLVVQANGKILVGGWFGVEGLGNYGLIRLNADGSLDTEFSIRSQITFSIYDFILASNEKIYYAGLNTAGRLNNNGDSENQTNNIVFKKIALQTDGKIVGYATNNYRILRYNADFTLDNTFQMPAISHLVNEIAIQSDGKIIIAGAISAVEGFPVSRIARLNANGTIDNTFNIGTNGPNNPIEALRILADGKILIGGSFTTFNGATGKYLARLNSSNGSLDTTFNSEIAEISNFSIYDFDIQADGKIVIASFPMFRLNADGAIDNSFTSPVIGSAGNIKTVFVQSDNKILVGGYFTRANEKVITHLARFNADGTVDNSFNQTYLPLNGSISAIAVQTDGKVVAGGNGFGGGVRFNADGSFDRLISTGAIVEDIKIQTDGKILMSGNAYIKRFNADGTPDTSFIPTVNARIYKIALQPDGKILIGGAFTQVNGTPRSGVARLNVDGTLDTTFNPLGGTSGAVLDLILQSNGKIIIGGDFTGVNFDTGKKYIARLNADGSLDATFAPVLDTRVRSLKLQSDGKILFGGITNLIVGNPVPGKLGRLNADGTLDTTFNNTMPIDQSVNSIDLQTDNKIILGGYFTRVNGVPSLGTARLLNSSARGVFDFDGDGKTDISIFRPAVGEWWYLRSSDGGNYAAQFGTSTDKLVPADFTGDGKTDIAFFRPSSGEWFILRSEDNSFYAFPFGAAGDIPFVGNFDTDNRSDVGVFRPSNSTWYIQKTSGGTDIVQFGATGDVPATGDYDGDGKTDIAIYRPSAGQWWIQRSTAGTIAYEFGAASDNPVQGDYTGDGKADVAFWRPSTGEWFVLRSEDLSFYAFPFGTSTDIPAPGDYDGDGRFDATVFRPSNSTWYSNRTNAGTLIQAFGITGDKPVPATFVP